VDVEDILLVAAFQRFSQDKIGNQPGADEKSVRLKETLLPLSAGKSKDVSGVPKVGSLNVFRLLTFEALSVVIL